MGYCFKQINNFLAYFIVAQQHGLQQFGLWQCSEHGSKSFVMCLFYSLIDYIEILPTGGKEKKAR